MLSAALQLVDPRHVTDVEFRDTDTGGREPRITIGYGPGSSFHCPEAGCGEASCPVHDTMERTWRHLNFFQCKAFIHASVPRVACPERGVGTATVPWARPGGGSTLLFEAMVVDRRKASRSRASPNRSAGATRDRGGPSAITWTRRACTRTARAWRRSASTRPAARGHRCITVVADPAERNVTNATPGRDAHTVELFARDFMARNGDPDRVRLATCDTGPGFAKGIRQWLPNAAKTIDRFHVIKHANEAVDRVRKAEAREDPPLKRTKYLWPGNESNLTDPQLEVMPQPADDLVTRGHVHKRRGSNPVSNPSFCFSRHPYRDKRR